MKFNSQLTQYLMIKLKKNQLKKEQKNPNQPLNPQPGL